MATIREYRGKWIRLRARLADESLAASAIEETKGELLEMNRDQLLHGENNKGEPLGFYKNRQYAQKKHQQNNLAGLGIKDHRLTGSYHESIYLVLQGNRLVFGATDPKAKKLETGEDYGLGPDARVIYIRETLWPAFIRKIKEALQ